MSKFSRIAPTTKSKFRKTEKPMSTSELVQTNQNAAATISRYQEVMSDRGYMSADDLSVYTSAVNTYVGTGNRLREDNRQKGAVYSEEDENRWQRSIARLSISSGKAHERYSPYETEDAWNQAVEHAKTTEMMLGENTAELAIEIAQLKVSLDALELEWKTVRNSSAESSDPTEPISGEWADYEAAISAKEKEIAEKEAYLEEANWLQDITRRESVADPNSENYDPEFADKSAYIPQAKTERSTFDIATDAYATDPWENPLYEAINGNAEALAYIGNKAAAQNSSDPEGGALGAIIGRLMYGETELLEMTEEEKKVYNYYANEVGADKAYEYYQLLESDLNARQRLKDMKENQKRAQEDPIGASLETVFMAPFKGISYAGQIVDYLGDGKIDENAAYNAFSYTSSDIRGEVSRMIEGDGSTWGKVGSWGYQLGMSMGDFVASTVAGGGNQTAVLMIMGTGAAADTTIAAKQRGLNDDQAFALGTIAGAAEVISEKIGFDALMDVALLGKSKLVYVLKNVFSEGLEEPASNLINTLADVIIAGDKSEWAMEIAAGKTTWEVIIDKAAELGLDALGGMLSGAFMGGGSTAIHAAWENFVHTNVVDTENQTDYDNITEQGGNVYAEGQGGYRDDRGLPQRDAFERRSQGEGDGTQSGGILSEQRFSERTGGPSVYDSGDRGSGSAVNQSGLTQYDGSETQDNEGNVFSKEIAEQIKGTTALAANGRPMMVYHGTPDMEFTNFAKGDTGFHFGTAEQAQKRLRDKKAKRGRLFQGYVVLRNPVVSETDIGRWDAEPFSMYLVSKGYITDSEYREVQALLTGERSLDSQYDTPAAVRLREILESKGYDGAIYSNFFEGDALSYMVFHDSQFIRAGISEYIAGNNDGRAVQSGESVTDVADRQSDSDSGAGGQLRQSVQQDVNALVLQDQWTDPRRAELEQNLQSLERDLKAQESEVAKKRARGVSVGWLRDSIKKISILKKLIAITDNALKKLEVVRSSQSSTELQLSESGESVEDNRKNVLDNSRTYGRIGAEGEISQVAVDQEQTGAERDAVLTAQDLLDRIGEFVDVAALSDRQQKALDAYKQQKQLLSDLEESRQTHENPAELDRQIAKAREKLQKIQERKVTKSVVNRVKQSIYHEYASEAIRRAQLQKKLASQQAALEDMYAQLDGIKAAGSESESLKMAGIQNQIVEYEKQTRTTEEMLKKTEKALAEVKSQASAIVDSNDRGVLLFDDRSIVEVGGKCVVIIDGLFDMETTDEDGRTNRQRLEMGYAPIGKDNKPLEIHHFDQAEDGVVIAIPRALHKKYDGMLHPNKGQAPSQINRAAFAKWRESYWKWVFQQQNEQLEGNYELSGFSESNGIGTEV